MSFRENAGGATELEDFSALDDAKRFKREVEGANADGDGFDPSAGKEALGAFAERSLAGKLGTRPLSPARQENYERNPRPYIRPGLGNGNRTVRSIPARRDRLHERARGERLGEGDKRHTAASLMARQGFRMDMARRILGNHTAT